MQEAKEKAVADIGIKKDIKEIKKMSSEFDRTAHEAKIAGQTETTLKGKLAKSIGLKLDNKEAEEEAKPAKLPEKKYTQ